MALIFNFSLGIQPVAGNAIDDIGTAAGLHKWKSMVVCVAYATQAGAVQLIGELAYRWSTFKNANKVFLIGFDFGLTEPDAVRYLSSLPNTSCHIFDANRTLAMSLRPNSRFHAKLYAFGSKPKIRSSNIVGGILGSVNLTGSGLTSNMESYSSFYVSSASASGRRWIDQLAVLETLALAQPKASETLLNNYERLRPSAPPVRTEIEAVPRSYSSRGEIHPVHFRALRTTRCLWTETRKIVENLGPGKPGNQIDLKRGVRVFFGSTVPVDAPLNTPLGTVKTMSGSGIETCNMRYGDNGMDKLNLPLPGNGNPPKYDFAFILWERIAGGLFKLHFLKDGKPWIRTSKREGTIFKYSGGWRSWGFFNAEVPTK